MFSTLRGRSVLLALLACVFTVLPWAAASAHSALISSNPSSGSTITGMPDQVELKFNDDISDIGAAVILRHGGKTVAKLTPLIDGRIVRADAPSELPDGQYQMVWRFVSADGHPIDGVVPFALGDGHEPAQTAPDRPEPAEAAGRPVAIALAIAAPVLLIAGIAIAVIRRRRLSTHLNSNEGTSS